VKPLAWDSDFFGRRIARLDSIPTDWRQRAEDQRIECLYYLVDASDLQAIRSAETAGFQLMDVRVTLAARLTARAARAATGRVRPARPEDVAGLEQIAASSHHDTRFYADDRFDRDRVDEMYRVWIRRSCADPDGRVWVLDEGAGPGGYSTCAPDGKIGLVAVAPDRRGRGAGHDLVQASLSWFAERGLTEVSVVTQGRNLAAQHLYQRCGFTTARIELWFHRWL
jgi:dTDP-4-amino-4,6-dideoxy-D-galactose acyltransferase